MKKLFFLIIASLFSFLLLKGNQGVDTTGPIHVWEMHEITLKAENSYENYYKDVTCWVDLKGPDFSRRIYGFWDGDNIFRVRIVATKPGKWQWVSGSDKQDKGLNDHNGEFTAIEWTENEKIQNSNRHGFIRPTPNGHALQYADNTPFFVLGDTWLAASTWRLPFRNSEPRDDYEPGPGIGFEEAVMYRKKQGFNSVSFIASFPKVILIVTRMEYT